MLPVVRMVVTPAARYRRGAEKAISVTKKPGGGSLPSSSEWSEVVHADQARDDGAAAQVEHLGAAWRRRGAIQHRLDPAAAHDHGAVFLDRAAGAVDHAHVGQGQQRGVMGDELADFRPGSCRRRLRQRTGADEQDG
jgi:hypothetical protein